MALSKRWVQRGPTANQSPHFPFSFYFETCFAPPPPPPNACVMTFSHGKCKISKLYKISMPAVVDPTFNHPLLEWSYTPPPDPHQGRKERPSEIKLLLAIFQHHSQSRLRPRDLSAISSTTQKEQSGVDLVNQSSPYMYTLLPTLFPSVVPIVRWSPV